MTDHVARLIEKNAREACEQRTPPWYAKRNEHVTASLMATVCNANPYETRGTALKKKTGRGKPFTGNIATEHGNKYESIAIEKYEQRSKQKVIEFGLLESLNHGEGFLAGSPDGITASGILIEVKCPFRRVPTDVVPDHYVYQVQFLMHTLRIAETDFVQFVPGDFWSEETLIITRLKYDPHFWRVKLPMLRSFWDEVLAIRAGLADNTIKDAEDEAADDDEVVEVVHRAKKRVISVANDDEEESGARRRAAKVKPCAINLCETDLAPASAPASTAPCAIVL